MKKISKFGLASTLSLCLVIGGVYATWNYAQGNISEASETSGIILEDAADDLADGSVTINNTAAFSIDDSDRDYHGEMVVTGSLTVTFTAAAGADAEVYNNGIDLKVTFTLPEENTYAFYNDATCTGSTIKAVFALGKTEMTIAKADLTKGGNGVFTYTFSAEDLNGIFALAETDGVANVYLPTHTAYTEFNDSFMNGKTFTVTVADGRSISSRVLSAADNVSGE